MTTSPTAICTSAGGDECDRDLGGQHEGDQPHEHAAEEERDQRHHHRLDHDTAEDLATRGPDGLQHAVEPGAFQRQQGEEQRHDQPRDEQRDVDDRREGGVLLLDPGERLHRLVGRERRGGPAAGGVDRGRHGLGVGAVGDLDDQRLVRVGREVGVGPRRGQHLAPGVGLHEEPSLLQVVRVLDPSGDRDRRPVGPHQDGVAHADPVGLEAPIGQCLVGRQLHAGRHAVDRELERGDRQVHQVLLARDLAADEGHTEATRGGDALDGVDPGPYLGVDAGADERVLGVGGEDDQLALLGSQQPGGSDVQAVEQTAEEQQQHRQQHQRRPGDGEPQGLAPELGQAQPHASPPAFCRFITSAGSMRPTRISVNSDPTSESSTTATAVTIIVPGSRETGRPEDAPLTAP